MNKEKFIKKNIVKIVENIEYDSDIEAINKFLNYLLDIDVDYSVKVFLDILNGYQMKGLAKDINFTSLFDSYFVNLVKLKGLNKGLEIVGSSKNKAYVYSLVFNVFLPNSSIYQIFRYIIEKGDKLKELEMINLVILELRCEKYFDVFSFIKNIIMIHEELGDVDIDYLFKIIDLVKNLKERAVLSSLLVDYL